jgi:hypothetical protein
MLVLDYSEERIGRVRTGNQNLKSWSKCSLLGSVARFNVSAQHTLVGIIIGKSLG